MKNSMHLPILFLISFITLPLTILAQSNTSPKCKVLKVEISENYEGDCKKGFAHGYGKASGLDEYEGNFKKGYPHGKGKYTYSNGNFYIGHWVKGVRDGMGLYLIRTDGKDSIITGYWKKDKYIENEKTDKGYRINLIIGVESYSVQKLNEVDNKVEMYFDKSYRLSIWKKRRISKFFSFFICLSLLRKVLICEIKYYSNLQHSYYKSIINV